VDVWLRPDCHVAWLASLAADLFEQWPNEVDGIIGHATSGVVPYLITGSLAVDMAAGSGESGGAGLVVEAWKTSAGRPVIVAWLPFPGALANGEGRVCYVDYGYLPGHGQETAEDIRHGRAAPILTVRRVLGSRQGRAGREDRCA